MRTTVEIDDELLRKALAESRAPSKKKVIEIALKELLRKKHRESLKNLIGRYDAFTLTHRKLGKMRARG